MPLSNLSQAAGAVIPIHTSVALQGCDSRDWSLRPRKNGAEPGGRRRAIRFPIKLPVRYQAGGESGWGETLNIGSRGVFLRTDRALALNARVEVYAQWPVLLHNSVRLSLILSGTIIRVEAGRAAIAVERYEFRTCLRSFFQRAQPRLAGEGVVPPGRFSRLAGVGQEISKVGLQRKTELNDARWERVFQEKFADPKYYGSRRLSHSSPTVDL
jgi:hypothetical protein